MRSHDRTYAINRVGFRSGLSAFSLYRWDPCSNSRRSADRRRRMVVRRVCPRSPSRRYFFLCRLAVAPFTVGSAPQGAVGSHIRVPCNRLACLGRRRPRNRIDLVLGHVDRVHRVGSCLPRLRRRVVVQASCLSLIATVRRPWPKRPAPTRRMIKEWKRLGGGRCAFGRSGSMTSPTRKTAGAS